MKSNYLFFLLIFFSFIFNYNKINAQNIDDMGNLYYAKILTNSSNYLSKEYAKSILTLDSVRALSEINKIDTADAYPYISSDGLRLYFTQGVGGNSSLYFVSRSNTNTNFTNKLLVSQYFPSNSIKGCWLANDERDIYYINSDTLYYSTRSSIFSAFSIPVRINLVGNIQGFINGPSLTPDTQELYLANSNNNDKSIFKFIKTGILSYLLIDTLSIPSGNIVRSGQLSKDGLKYLLSFENPITNISKIHQYNRITTNSIFDTSSLTILDTNINSANSFHNIQPTISSDEKIIIWVRSNMNSWTKNDLYMAYTLASSIPESILPNTIKTYPNPTNNKITIDCTNIQYENLTLYNIIGELVFQKELNTGKNVIDISSLSKGIYIIKLINGIEIIQQKLIKK